MQIIMRKIVVASDSFKGCLSSAQVADAVEKGIHEIYPDCEVVKLAVADGGEGTIEALAVTLGGSIVEVQVQRAHASEGRGDKSHALPASVRSPHRKCPWSRPCSRILQWKTLKKKQKF